MMNELKFCEMYAQFDGKKIVSWKKHMCAARTYCLTTRLAFKPFTLNNFLLPEIIRKKLVLNCWQLCVLAVQSLFVIKKMLIPTESCHIFGVSPRIFNKIALGKTNRCGSLLCNNFIVREGIRESRPKSNSQSSSWC